MQCMKHEAYRSHAITPAELRSAIPGVRHSGGPPFRRSAINDDLALTLTTEPVYKIFFTWGLCPLPRPLPRIPPPYC